MLERGSGIRIDCVGVFVGSFTGLGLIEEEERRAWKARAYLLSIKNEVSNM